MRHATGLIVVIALVFVVAGCAPAGAVADSARTVEGGAEAPVTVLITGANRGLGLEFATQLSAQGYAVIGTARKPEQAKELAALPGVRVEKLDVASTESVRALAKRLGDHPLDVLINNAGILQSKDGVPVNDGIDELDVDSVARVYEVNALGPLRVTQALLPNLRAGTRKLIVHISSRMGSIGDNNGGGYYAYRSSKAALNMLNKSLALELADDGFTCVVMHPGWVKTDMGGPNARLEPEESIAGMLTVIDGLGPEQNGRFFDHSGQELPW